MLGLTIPFSRASRDLGTAEDVALLRARIRQVLLTEGATARSEGELPWRTNFGSGLYLLRHQNNTAVLGEIARVYIRDALKKWLPEVEVVSVSTSQQDNVLRIGIVVRISQAAMMPVQVELAYR